MLKEYITNKQPSNYVLDGIEVNIKDLGSLQYNGVKDYISRFQKLIPGHLRRGIKKILIGSFDYLESRDLTAAYSGGVIYISNTANDEYILDEIVHELAHSVEELYAKEIYSDSQIEREYKLKKETLWMRLKDKGFEIKMSDFLKSEYSEKVDIFLYKKVGYPLLRTLSSDLFLSPYAATSLREYFANGFESYWLKEELSRLRRTSPRLYEKIESITDMEKINE
jgi:hypothetical protein